jgi:hypothetical protein
MACNLRDEWNAELQNTEKFQEPYRLAPRGLTPIVGSADALAMTRCRSPG